MNHLPPCPRKYIQMADDRGLDFRLTTFNLLAPCYKRMHAGALPPALSESARSGLLAGQATVSHRTARESEFADVWRQRAVETVSPWVWKTPIVSVVLSILSSILA